MFLDFDLVTYSLSLVLNRKKSCHHCLLSDSIPLLVMIRENLVELQELPIPGSRYFLQYVFVRFIQYDLG